VVVGQSSSGSGETQAFRWTQATGMVGLSDLPGGLVNSSAKGVSADGSIIVGFGTPTNFARAFIWDATHQMRNLQDVLINDYGLGASLTGWTLHEASAISADGKFITGYATNPTGGIEGWLVNLAASSPTLDGDYNGNGIVDAADYSVWRDHLGQSVTLPNDTTPGTMTQADYDVWKANFGNHAGSGSGAGAAVPEPTSLTMLVVGVLTIFSRRLRTVPQTHGAC
jgi:probable HAF family extracellular repeat protein